MIDIDITDLDGVGQVAVHHIHRLDRFFVVDLLAHGGLNGLYRQLRRGLVHRRHGHRLLDTVTLGVHRFYGHWEGACLGEGDAFAVLGYRSVTGQGHLIAAVIRHARHQFFHHDRPAALRLIGRHGGQLWRLPVAEQVPSPQTQRCHHQDRHHNEDMLSLFHMSLALFSVEK